MHTRKGSGDIGTESWFCKLSNHVIICIDLQWNLSIMTLRIKDTSVIP